jgi:hypothetical protein
MTILISIPTHDGIVLVSDMRVTNFRSSTFKDDATKMKRIHSHCVFGTVGSPIYTDANDTVHLNLTDLVFDSLSSFDKSETLANPREISLDLVRRLDEKVHSVNAAFNQDTQFLVYEYAKGRLKGHYFNIMLHVGQKIKVAEDPIQFQVDPFKDLIHGWSENRINKGQIPYQALADDPHFKMALAGRLLSTADALKVALKYFNASFADKSCTSISPTFEALSITQAGLQVEIALGSDCRDFKNL